MQFFGLKTCDTCRKAQKALREAGHDLAVTDVRADSLTEAEIAQIVEQFGDTAINRASTTWRGLSAADKEGSPEALLTAHPTLMKRPVITDGTTWTIGWKKEAQAQWLGAADA